MQIATNMTDTGILRIFVDVDSRAEPVRICYEGFYFTHGGLNVYVHDDFGDLVDERRGQRLMFTRTATTAIDIHNHGVRSDDFAYMGH